jgi:protein involved in polysaccharide export with SLBB domain
VKLISRAYVDQKIFIKPTITVTVKTYAERRINVLGQVSSPGWVIIPPQQDLTLVSAIAQAHGPTPRAYHIVNITRKESDGSIKTYTADLRAAMKGTGPDFPLEEGDTINVTESLIGNDFQ